MKEKKDFITTIVRLEPKIREKLDKKVVAEKSRGNRSANVAAEVRRYVAEGLAKEGL